MSNSLADFIYSYRGNLSTRAYNAVMHAIHYGSLRGKSLEWFLSEIEKQRGGSIRWMVRGIGDTYLDKLRQLASYPPPVPVRHPIPSERDKEILEFLEAGKATRDIATQYGISQARVNQIKQKHRPDWDRRRKPQMRYSTCVVCGEVFEGERKYCKIECRRSQYPDGKECTKCGATKPLTEFYTHRRADGSLRPQPRCKTCQNQAVASRAAYRYKTDPGFRERYRDTQLRYAERNRDVRRAHARERYRNDPDYRAKILEARRRSRSKVIGV